MQSLVPAALPEIYEGRSVLSSLRKKTEATICQRIPKRTPVVPMGTTWDTDFEVHGVRERSRI